MDAVVLRVPIRQTHVYSPPAATNRNDPNRLPHIHSTMNRRVNLFDLICVCVCVCVYLSVSVSLSVFGMIVLVMVRTTNGVT